MGQAAMMGYDAKSEIQLMALPGRRVAYVRHVGPYGSPEITAMFQRFRGWCAANGLLSPGGRLFGIAQDNPNITPPERTRYDACVEVDDAFEPGGGMGVQTLPGGRFACSRFVGIAAEIKAAWVRLLGWEIPAAGYVPDLCPAVEIYDADFMVDPARGVFSCLLCMPVREE